MAQDIEQSFLSAIMLSRNDQQSVIDIQYNI